jgi:uncharacterized membrane protein
MKNIVSSMIILAFLIFAACSKKASPGKSTAKATTFADVQPLMQAKCSPCHYPSKNGNKASFETYASAQKYAADMITRIEKNPGDRGFMPFRNPKLTEAEITVFKNWAAGGALEK